MQTISQKILGGGILLILIGTLIGGAMPQTTHAQAGAASCSGSVGVGAGAAAAASAVTVPTFDLPQFPQTMKECLFDGIVVLVREAFIEVLVSSIVQWINSGFQGSPAFITNLDAFLLGVLDRAAGAFIESSDLGFLCSPFELQIRIALALEYFAPYGNRISCTLTDVVNNTQDFIDGTFSEGGWRGWFELTTRPHNNPYGAYLDTKRELEVRLQTAEGRESIQLDWGDGFKGFETCRDRETNPSDVGGTPGQTVEECVTGTPGTVINQQLNWTLSTGQRQLELADEIDEIIGALLGQLAKQVLTGIGGLLGSSQPSYDGSSYLDRIRSQQDVRVTGRKAQVEDYISQQISGVRATETRYGDAKESALASVSSAESAVTNVASCYANKLEQDSQNASFLTQEEAQTARDRRDAAQATLNIEIEPRREDLEDAIEDSNDNIDALDDLQQDIAIDLEDVRTALELQDVLDDFNSDPLFDSESGSSVHSTQDASDAEAERDTILEQMDSIQSTAESNLATCNAFPPSNSQGGGN